MSLWHVAVASCNGYVSYSKPCTRKRFKALGSNLFGALLGSRFRKRVLIKNLEAGSEKGSSATLKSFTSRFTMRVLRMLNFEP